MRIIFLGPPAAGKGTQAQKIQNIAGIPLIVMGDILRASIQQQDESGKIAENYVKKGALVPDDLILSIIMKRFSQSDCQTKGFLLDGFPRTITQAEALDKAMIKDGYCIDKVLYYTMDDSVSIERLCGRRVCKQCSAVYHEQNKPSKVSNVCDLCGGELWQREDDKVEVMKVRLATFHEKTAPLIEYYQKKGVLTCIDASRSIDEISQESLTILGLK